MEEILSGGLTWGSIQQAIVTMDKEGHPLTCCNPVTGECLGGGGSSDFSTAEVTIENHSRRYLQCSIPVLNDDALISLESLNDSYSDTINVVLYKGSVQAYIESANISVTGDISVDEYGFLTITGDGTITIDDAQ